MTKTYSISRRQLLVGGSALGVAAALTPLSRARAANMTVGFIYVGPHDDYGYNQAHAEAAAVLKKMPGVKVVEEENVPETVDVQKTMESMIKLDGATLLFPTSFGYFDPHMLALRREISRRPVPPLRRPVDRRQAPEERRLLFRLYRRGRSISTASSPATRRRSRSSASSPPSRSRRCCATSTPSRSARASVEPDITTPGDLHRRLVAAGQGSRGDQQPGRPGRRRHHLPRRQPEGGGRDRGAARRLRLRLPRQPGQARARSTT